MELRIWQHFQKLGRNNVPEEMIKTQTQIKPNQVNFRVRSQIAQCTRANSNTHTYMYIDTNTKHKTRHRA